MNEDQLLALEEDIKDNTEWLQTLEKDEVACISIENLEVILNNHLETRRLKLKLTS